MYERMFARARARVCVCVCVCVCVYDLLMSDASTVISKAEFAFNIFF
jgi:hypothetical protein